MYKTTENWHAMIEWIVYCFGCKGCRDGPNVQGYAKYSRGLVLINSGVKDPKGAL